MILEINRINAKIKLPKKKRNHYEHYQQKALFKWAGSQLSVYPQLKWMYANPNSARRSHRLSKWMKGEGLKAGVWDIFLPFPSSGKHGLYIEMKSPGNGLMEKQEEFKLDNEKYFQFVVCYDWVMAKNIIELYLAGDRF